ncbi:MAG: MATE family efflux transporter, partial [Pseudomonadota bacterium]
FAHSPEIAAQATGYLFAFLGVLFGEVFAITLTNYFNATGDTRSPLFSYLLALPLNVALSAALIYGFWSFPALGVMGAAIGSAVAALIRALFLGIVMARENGWLMRHAGWHGSTFADAFKRHLLFSLPIAATFISATTAATACGLIYAGLSINYFAAMTLILPWIQFVGTLGMAWAQAAGIIVGQMLGSQDDTRRVDQFLREAWQGALAAACLVAVIYVALCLTSGVLYANLEQETRRALYSFLPILMILPFPKGSNAMCGHSLRAGGDTVYVMKLFVLSQWLVRVPFTFVLVFLLDVHVAVVLFILLLEEFVKFIPFHSRFKSGHWKTAKVLTD